ncbi:MAG TPA: D-alanine--D-alanine ligase [Patescibacteria group bacterium]|nr:D-alanine--D-alanine ligase [Patescibacteria group bacterium]
MKNKQRRKLNIAILFGGRSAEHEVSLQSAKNIIVALDKEKYNPILIGIDKKGTWYLYDSSHFLLHAKDPKLITLNKSEQSVVIAGHNKGEIIGLSSLSLKQHIDVVFPVLHGTYGEDGTIQGLLKLAGVPFVGASILGSAIGMDKDVMKRLLRDAGIPTARFLVFKKNDKLHFDNIVKQLGLPFFVKPANLGSSVGVTKVKNHQSFLPAIDEAFQYDRKILVEHYIQGREIECSVLGNENPITSLPGEIIVKREFYSYEAKYIDANGVLLQIPASLPPHLTKKVQELAIKTFRVLCGEGMARVDFFLKKNGDLVINEINTIPGFTAISMYPKLWEVSGISYSELIDRLIQLAFARFKEESLLKTTVSQAT